MSDNVKLVDVSDELKANFLTYAEHVIRDRSIPDVRDGLKPVHRRILWTMHEMGATSSAQTKKSARISGECFVKGELVHAKDGLIPIEEVLVGQELRAPNGGTARVTQCYHNTDSKVVRVILSSGQSVVVTDGQLFMVLNNDLSCSWVPAKRLQGRTVLLSNFKDSPPSASKSDSLEAYCCGLMVAEGYKADRKRTPTRLGITMSDSEPIESFNGLDYRKEKPFVRESKTGGKNLFGIRFRSDKMQSAVEELCYLKKVPKWILEDRSKFAPFLSGYFDGDGCAKKDAREIVFTSTSPELARQIHVMLVDVGVQSSITLLRRNNPKRHSCWQVCCYGSNASVLAGQLAEYSKIKTKRIRLLSMSGFSGTHKYHGFEQIPAHVVFDELSRLNLGGGWYLTPSGSKVRMGIKHPCGCKIRYHKNLKNSMLSFRHIVETGILEKLRVIGSPLYPLIDNLINKYRTATVIGVEDAGTFDTYDVQVDSPSHDFVVNGVVVHNCLGKYHPHGDMAIYDAMVRLAQSFSVSIPLVDGRGNFGSVDGFAPASQRYCLPTGSPILLENGTSKNIENLKIGDMVLTHRGVSRPVERIIPMEHKELIRIELVTNFVVYCSPNHPLLVWRDNEWQWVRCEGLLETDCLAQLVGEGDGLTEANDIDPTTLTAELDSSKALRKKLS